MGGNCGGPLLSVLARGEDEGVVVVDVEVVVLSGVDASAVLTAGAITLAGAAVLFDVDALALFDGKTLPAPDDATLPLLEGARPSAFPKSGLPPCRVKVRFD
jgi:hypothetical protein